MNIVTQTDLSLFETSKTERQEFAQVVINNAKEGLLNPLKLHLINTERPLSITTQNSR